MLIFRRKNDWPGFLRVGATIALALALLSGQARGQDKGTPKVETAAEGADGIVHSKRLSAGVPLGGVGAGTFEFMTDGTISHATYNNNWAQPTGDLPGCFIAIWTRSADLASARVLALESAYHLPVVSALDYDGIYPQALLTFPRMNSPVSFLVRAFSPLIPFDLRNSSFPAGAFIVYLANTSSSPVEVSLALSWENTLGVGQGADSARFADRTGNEVQAIPDVEGFFGMRYTGPPRLPAGTPSDPTLENARGEMTLLAYPPRKEAIVTTAGWNALDAHPGWWDGFAQNGQVAGTAPTGQEGSRHPAGVVAVKLTLKPGDRVEIPFAIAWYTPALRTPAGGDYGHYYQVAFPDSYHAARTLLDDWRSLLALTEEWQKKLLYSDLPPWLSRRLINSAMPLTGHTFHTRDGRFAWLPETGLLPEGPSPAPKSLSRREPSLQASALLLAFFPQLQARRLDQYLSAQTPEGYFPGDWRDPFRQLGASPKPVKPLAQSDYNPDLLLDPALKPPFSSLPAVEQPLPQQENFGTTTAFVLQLAQYALWTGDHAFLYRAMPGVRRALRNQIRNSDAEGLPLAARTLPEGKYRPSLLVSWLAALQAGQRLAKMTESLGFFEASHSGFLGPIPEALAEKAANHQFAAECQTAFIRAQAGITRLLANGSSDKETEGVPLYSAEVAALIGVDTLPGNWFADQLNLEPLLPAPILQEVQHRLRQANGDIAPADALLQGHAGDWNALYTLQGFRYDDVEKRLTLSPQIPGDWRSLKCPVFAPTFWGRLEFKPTVHGALLTLRVDRVIALSAALPAHKSFGSIGGANVILRSLRVPGPLSEVKVARDLSGVHVSLGSNPVGFQVTRDPSGDLILTFAAPITLVAGSRLEIDVH